ncbi:MAG TPA: hypothetical protein VFU21_07045 [Kofleriaceae bacterium]|nr:hypothetical protein [Kofleriaceae bacterium]
MEDMYRYMMMSAMNIFVSPIITVAVAMPVIIYIVARWRTYRDHGGGDPHLGIKVAICVFRIAAFQLLLAGGFLFLYGLMTTMDGEARMNILRLAGGLFIPGLLVFGAHTVALHATNFASMPAVVRMFNGVNMVQTGVGGFVSLVLVSVLMLQKDVPSEMNRMAWSLLLVYLPAWVAQGALFMRSTVDEELPKAVVRQPDDVSRTGS